MGGGKSKVKKTPQPAPSASSSNWSSVTHSYDLGFAQVLSTRSQPSFSPIPQVQKPTARAYASNNPISYTNSTSPSNGRDLNLLKSTSFSSELSVQNNLICDIIGDKLSILSLKEEPITDSLISKCGPSLIKTEIKAVVVGHADKKRIVQTLPEVGNSQFCILDIDSNNQNDYISRILPNIQTIIKIQKIGLYKNGEEPIVKFYIEEFVVEELPSISLGQETVVVVDTVIGAVNVVGNHFVQPTLVPWLTLDRPVQAGDYVIGNVYRLEPFYLHSMVQVDGHDVVVYQKCLQAERQYLKEIEKYKNNPKVVSKPRDPENSYYMFGMRTLTKEEIYWIANNCRNISEISLEKAHLYIRDVFIATARLERVVRAKSIDEHTLKVSGETEIDYSGSHKCIYLTVNLTLQQADKVIRDKSQDTWRVGTDLSIRHPMIERYIKKQDRNKQYEGGMTIQRIKDQEDGGCLVRFRPHLRSYDLFDMLAKTNTIMDGAFTIGPTEENRDIITETLNSKAFDDFVLNRSLFDSWRGIKKNDNVAIENNDFDVNGQQLDSSQVQALRTAINNPGITCVEAPPGSGKTFLITALIAAKYREKGPNGGSFCITATTNNAISNAIDKAYKEYPHIRAIREYSKKMEGEISEESKKISLREMALNASKHLVLSKYQDVIKSIEIYNQCKAALKTIKNVQQGLQLIDELMTADYNLRTTFINAYQPYVLGSTCELIARRGDVIHDKFVKAEDERKELLRKKRITHLIVDEASQLPPHMALAVYIRLPALQQITLIGDSEQLGPYTPLDEKTFAYRMIGTGELNRIQAGTKVYLRQVYRSHPRIVTLLLKPIYGNELSSGLTPNDRDLSFKKNLLCADDFHTSPVLFVNIENGFVNKRGVNNKELRVVLAFINTLKKKGVTGEDVVVLCNHHAQREAIINTLKGQGEIGCLNLPIAVHTVDSFQGKEAKVILLLTTKTSPNPMQARNVFQFVANPNRGCVAVSRAQHAVYLFGEWFNLVRTEFWSRFVDGIIESRAMVSSNWQRATIEHYRKLKVASQHAFKRSKGIRGIDHGGRRRHANRSYGKYNGLEKEHTKEKKRTRRVRGGTKELNQSDQVIP